MSGPRTHEAPVPRRESTRAGTRAGTPEGRRASTGETPGRSPARSAGTPAGGTPDAQTSHDPTELLTGEAVALDVRPVGFVLRAAGALVDALAYVLLLVVLAWFLMSVVTDTGVDAALGQALLIALLVFCIVIVPTLVETLSRGRSLGKLMIGARIVRDDGGAIGLRHAFIRALTAVFEIFMTVGGLAALVALLNGRSKRVGDLLAGTYSQNERVPEVVPMIRPVPEPLHGWAQVADVARLPDPLARRLATFLGQAHAMTPGTRGALAAQLATETSAYVSPLPAVPPEIFLAGVVALRQERENAALVLERERLARLAPALTGTPHGFPTRG